MHDLALIIDVTVTVCGILYLTKRWIDNDSEGTLHRCDGCKEEFPLKDLRVDEGDSLLCNPCFKDMMKSAWTVGEN